MTFHNMFTGFQIAKKKILPLVPLPFPLVKSHLFNHRVISFLYVYFLIAYLILMTFEFHEY